MEAHLLCDEVWLMSPITAFDHSSSIHEHDHNMSFTPKTSTNDTTTSNNIYTSFCLTKEDCENALKTCLHKEPAHMPQSQYVEHLESNPSIVVARFKSTQWLLQSQSRFALSFGTVFNAVNYLDRFISMNRCHEWKCWMFELLSVACLSIACKFGETAFPQFHEMQEGLDYSFVPSLIQHMELSVLKAMGWGLNCVTPFSYVELMTWEMNFSSTIKPHLVEEITSQLVELLASSLLDHKFLAFRPCVIATSGWKCLLKELLPCAYNDAHIAHITTFIPQDQMENLMKCDKLMEDISVKAFDQKLLHTAGYGRQYSSAAYYYPSSPVTVLTEARVEISVEQVDFSLLKVPALGLNHNKRKREEN